MSASPSPSLPAGNHSNRPSPRQQYTQQQQQQQQHGSVGNHWQEPDYGCYDSYCDDSDQYRPQRFGVTRGSAAVRGSWRRARLAHDRGWEDGVPGGEAESPRVWSGVWQERGGGGGPDEYHPTQGQYSSNDGQHSPPGSNRVSRYQAHCTATPAYQQYDRYNSSGTTAQQNYRAHSAPPTGGLMSRSAPASSGLPSHQQPQQQRGRYAQHQQRVQQYCADNSPYQHQVASRDSRYRSSSNQNVSAPVFSSQSGWPAVTSLSASSGRRHGNDYHHHSNSVVNVDYEPC